MKTGIFTQLNLAISHFIESAQIRRRNQREFFYEVIFYQAATCFVISVQTVAVTYKQALTNQMKN